MCAASLPKQTKPPTGRRARRKAHTRERIFRAALELFAAQGFAATTIEQITEAAGVGKGTFFNYFPSKEHALAAFGEMQLGKMDGVLADPQTAHQPAGKVLRRMVGALAEEPGRSPALVRALLGAVLSNPAARELMQRNLQRGRERLAEWLASAQQRGEVRADVSAAELARVAQQAFFGTLLLWAIDSGGNLVDRLDAVVQALGPARVLPDAAPA